MSLHQATLFADADLSRAVVNSMSDVVILVHDMANDARVVYANEAACRHFGVDLETLLTWTPACWAPYHDPKRAVSMALPNGQPRCFEAEHLIASGEKVPVEVTLSRLNLPGCNFLLSSNRDLRPRRLTEAYAYRLEMWALEMRLARSDKSVYDNLLDSVFLFDVAPDGELIVAGYNRRAEALTGLLEKEGVGRRKQDILPSGSHVAAASLEHFCVADGVPMCFRDSLALPGGRRQIENTLIPLSDAKGRVQRVISIVHDITERHRTEVQIRYQANYDSLTSLPNRTLLNAHLTEMMSERKCLALLYIDIDNFKEINDTLGHHLGDLMLEVVAHRLRTIVPQEDLVARMSGDEFIVVLSNTAQAERIAEEVRVALADNYEVGHDIVWASVSIGIALYPEQARDKDELLSHADQALYAAKTAGRNCLRLFDQAMHEKTQLRVRLARDLRTALQAGQLSVHFQPIIDLDSGQVMKAEALLRWQHPELGSVSPAVFIPVAEEMGAIHEIGDWVFREAARVAMQWNHQVWDGESALRRISVNRSPRQFFTRESCDDWISYLHANDIPGGALGVEITEGLLLDDRPDVMRQLATFRKEGIAISLDDFGTGYSALSYLKTFDIDYLKIDRSFVHDIVSVNNSRTIVESVVGMAEKLGIRVIAEGVEDLEQAEVLAAVGCRLAQGYLYARPMPEQDFMAFVTAEVETMTQCRSQNY